MKKSSKEFKQMQRDRILQTKPWLKSTGPATAKGKEKSKMNALKTDAQLYVLMKEMAQLMKQQKEIYGLLSNKGTGL